MSDELDLVHRSIERQQVEGTASTRRTFVKGAAATIGGAALLGTFPKLARASGNNDVQTILNVAATAEVLATIVNTVGANRSLGGDAVTQTNIEAAAREELIHYQVLVNTYGAVPVTKKIWVPDAVFASRTNLLETLVAGDQIFVNAYLIGVSCFSSVGGALATVPAEFMGVEAVHRALALQSLGRLGNDRVFMAVEFFDILDAVTRLQAAGFGFGEPGAKPGKFYEFDKVSQNTPNPAGLNTKTPTPVTC